MRGVDDRDPDPPPTLWPGDMAMYSRVDQDVGNVSVAEDLSWIEA